MLKKLVTFMSPVPPVFHAVVTVSIGLKNVLRVGTSIPFIIRFQIEAPNLIQLLTEDRLGHSNGPVRSSSPLQRFEDQGIIHNAHLRKFLSVCKKK